MTWISVDVEADGPIPGDYSMVWFGAVVVKPGFEFSFEGKLAPISTKYIPDALAIASLTREETLEFPDPRQVMEEFKHWVLEVSKGKRVFFIADNNGFDWSFINWYFHHFLGENPFGYSSQNLGSLYKGLVKNVFENFKHLRVTEHTHNPVDDARGNAEALLFMKNQMGLKIALE
jgi:hypothetical protein